MLLKNFFSLRSFLAQRGKGEATPSGRSLFCFLLLLEVNRRKKKKSNPLKQDDPSYNPSSFLFIYCYWIVGFFLILLLWSMFSRKEDVLPFLFQGLFVLFFFSENFREIFIFSLTLLLKLLSKVYSKKKQQH